MSSEEEDDLFSTDEESTVWKGLLHVEDLCEVSPSCHFALDVIFLRQDLALELSVSQAVFVAEVDCGKRPLGLRTMCQQSLLDVLSSEDEDDMISSDDEDEHKA